MRAFILIGAAAAVAIAALPELRNRLTGRADDPAARPVDLVGALAGARQAAGDALLGAWDRVRAVSWELPERAAPYADLIAEAEARYRLPGGLLGRVLYQESRFRPEIIDGRIASRAGALGIAQFMPETAEERGIDPLDPASSIDGAAAYLRDLYEMFGDWALALTAYNWGLGNVRRKGIGRAPQESRDYATLILSDVNIFS